MPKPKPFTTAAGVLVIGLTMAGCGSGETADSEMQALIDQYATVQLTSDLSSLTDKERQMIPLLIDAAEQMDALFWHQAYGNKDSLLGTASDAATRRYLEINYGPWDRLDDDAPFIEGVGPKPPGANLYPADMTQTAFQAALDAPVETQERLRSLYTLVRKNADGSLRAVPYREEYQTELTRAASKLREAAALAEDPGLKRYLETRAEALVTDEYRESDLAWMDMKTNTIEVVIGAIETYEDQLFGYKAAYEAFVLIKDKEWSERLSRFATFLPDLQRALPVSDAYKREAPGTDSDLNAYDAVYYAGDANAGSKTIAINLPNDESVQLEKGTRRLQLKNAMRAKFDKILVPIANELMAEDQRQYITFDAFFANTMFHEVAHGLGIKQTVNGRGTVREALKEHASAMEEGKADVLGLFMVTELHDRGELGDADLRDYYTTFLASIFRSVRFGASSAHGLANMVRFNYFQEQGAFAFDAASGTYRADYDKMREAMRSLSKLILELQGGGNYAGAGTLIADKATIGPELQANLDRLATAGIPVDIVFEQGIELLGL